MGEGAATTSYAGRVHDAGFTFAARVEALGGYASYRAICAAVDVFVRRLRARNARAARAALAAAEGA